METNKDESKKAEPTKKEGNFLLDPEKAGKLVGNLESLDNEVIKDAAGGDIVGGNVPEDAFSEGFVQAGWKRAS